MKAMHSKRPTVLSQLALAACILAATVWAGGPIVAANAQTKPAAQAAPAHDDHDHDAAQHDAGAHVHADAAKMVNPVKSTADSLAAGKAIYDKQCTSCHGPAGLGDGKSGTLLTPKPSNLADASWKHGPSDGEIFTLIKDGSKNTAMKGYASKMTTQEMWSVVNYIRSLKAK